MAAGFFQSGSAKRKQEGNSQVVQGPGLKVTRCHFHKVQLVNWSALFNVEGDSKGHDYQDARITGDKE